MLISLPSFFLLSKQIKKHIKTLQYSLSSFNLTQPDRFEKIVNNQTKERFLVSIWLGRLLFPRRQAGCNRISCWVKSSGLLWEGNDWRWDTEEDQIWLPPRLRLSPSVFLTQTCRQAHAAIQVFSYKLFAIYAHTGIGIQVHKRSLPLNCTHTYTHTHTNTHPD